MGEEVGVIFCLKTDMNVNLPFVFFFEGGEGVHIVGELVASHAGGRDVVRVDGVKRVGDMVGKAKHTNARIEGGADIGFFVGFGVMATPCVGVIIGEHKYTFLAWGELGQRDGKWDLG